MSVIRLFKISALLKALRLLVLLFLIGPAAQAAYVNYWTYKPAEDGPTYRIAVIINRDLKQTFWERWKKSPHSNATALRLAKLARAWTQDQFIKAYPDYSVAEFEAMNHTPLNDPREIRVIALKGDSDEIVGSLKLVYDDRKTPLPIEEIFGPYHRPLPDYHMYTEYDLSTWGLKNSPQVTGEVVQLMEFVVDKSARGDLNSVLHFASEYALAGSEVKLPTVSIPKERRPKGMKRSDFYGRYMPGGETPDNTPFENHVLMPAQYVLYCDSRLVPYYQSLGFNEFARKGEKLHAMVISREQFAQISMASPFFKRAYNKLDTMGLAFDIKGNGKYDPKARVFPAGLDQDRHGENIKRRLERFDRNQNMCAKVFSL